MLAVTIVGLIIGSIELLFLNRYFAKSSFLKKITGKLIIYSLFLFLVICITFPIAASIELQVNISDSVVWTKFFDYLNSISFLSTGFQMAISLGASLFYAEIKDNIGQGVLLNFFSGKYHKPKEENRIFMFLDMKSSTSIAEKLGHIKYFELLKEYYYYLSAAVVEYSGEIYQYVGDEMVISWRHRNGVKDNNCLKCFFAMKDELKNRQDWFQKNFGLSPKFKAGLHFGLVTTGEIGTIKKEIIFTGDVLNTTARIQALCNSHHVDILISEDLVKILQIGDEFQIKSVGKNILRGKTETMELYTSYKS